MSDRLIDQAPDMYCQELVRVDKLGPNRRLIFTLPSADSPGYQVVQIKLIVPAETIPTLITMLASGCEAFEENSAAAVLQAFVPKPQALTVVSMRHIPTRPES